MTFKILAGGAVTDLSCREFLIRTLAFEMAPTYHAEALKAQAVAAYTYYGRRQRAQTADPDPTLNGAHFKTPDDTFPKNYTVEKLRERWGDKFVAYYANLCAAVDAVAGKHITYNGEWIDACYFAISNGSTESAKTVWGTQVPYLPAVASPGDKLAANYETKTTLTVEQVKTALTAADAAVTLGDDPAAWFGEPTLSAAGTVASIPVGGKTLAGTAVRAALDLRSATFAIAYADGSFTFTVRGYRHNVGMSQAGAKYMANNGADYREILSHYYPGTTIR
jgi:stage II sporulation protein D